MDILEKELDDMIAWMIDRLYKKKEVVPILLADIYNLYNEGVIDEKEKSKLTRKIKSLNFDI